MPFVSIKLYEGRSHEEKMAIADKITEAFHGIAKIPKEYIWVVFEDIPKSDWVIAGKSGKQD